MQNFSDSSQGEFDFIILGSPGGEGNDADGEAISRSRDSAPERRTMVINRAYTYKPKNLGERLRQAYFRSRGRDVVREDLNTLEAQQAMLSSGAMSEVVLSRQETCLKHHYRVMENILTVNADECAAASR